jgi:peptidoglycan hydrolase-like protein with peptidoglycan-binding domain
MLRRGPVRAALAFAVLAGMLSLAAGAAASSGRTARKASYGHRTLSLGSRGADVKQLQRYLAVLGFRVHADGVFGAATAARVKAFERSENQRADGRVTVAEERLIKQLVIEGAGDGGAQWDPNAKSGNPTAKARISSDGRTAIPPDNAPPEVKAVIEAANQITDKPYRYGGGHGSWNDSGYDCSGSVSYALHGGGFLDSPEDSSELESWGSAGAGQWITVYANSGHAYMVVAGLRFDTSSAGSPSSADDSGPRWRRESRSPSGYVARHPDGF